MSGPTWYDVLGVEPTASSDEIRTAWRSTIADLDPADPRFKTANSAAEVLLDDDRRTAYDAELAPADEPLVEPGGRQRARVETPDADPATSERSEPERASAVAASWLPAAPTWLLTVLGVLVLLLAVAAGWLLTKPTADDVQESLSQAQRATETALPTVLAYDFRSMEDDRAAAKAQMTEEYGETYDERFSQLAGGAEKEQPVVTAEVVASGVVRSDHEADQVAVYAFVDQTVSTANTQPVTYRNTVTVTLERQDDEWLIDDMQTRSSGVAPGQNGQGQNGEGQNGQQGRDQGQGEGSE